MVLNESQLKTIILESVKRVVNEMLYEGVDELSPELLQRATDKAWDARRWSQAENFENYAAKRATEEFGGLKGQVRRITPRQIVWMSDEDDACMLYNDGAYYFQPRSGFNKESGNFKGLNNFPKYMKISDKITARAITRWWKRYHKPDVEIPFLEDWHNVVAW